jgi:3-oxoacyl-[acyl-carrier protein] reductase
MKGRVALVTGGARGMGVAHARALGSAGASVAMADIDLAELEASAALLSAEGLDVRAYEADISNSTACAALVANVVEDFGAIDILVHNAGRLFSLTGLENTDDDDFDATMRVNVNGPLYLTRAALPWLSRSENGRVIFISSQWGQVPDGHSYGYMTSKAAQLGLMKTMAKEFASQRILVNAITPGAIQTRMVPEDRIADEIAAIPINRLGQVEDIANAVAFLASDNASFITGQVLSPNGGACIVGI